MKQSIRSVNSAYALPLSRRAFLPRQMMTLTVIVASRSRYRRYTSQMTRSRRSPEYRSRSMSGQLVRPSERWRSKSRPPLAGSTTLMPKLH